MNRKSFPMLLLVSYVLFMLFPVSAMAQVEHIELDIAGYL